MHRNLKEAGRIAEHGQVLEKAVLGCTKGCTQEAHPVAPNDGEDFLEKNLPLFIPVSLAGRVHTKVIGPVNTGDCIVLSHIPGVGRAAKPCEYVDPCKVVGYAVEGDDLTEQRRLKVRVRGA